MLQQFIIFFTYLISLFLFTVTLQARVVFCFCFFKWNVAWVLKKYQRNRVKSKRHSKQCFLCNFCCCYYRRRSYRSFKCFGFSWRSSTNMINISDWIYNISEQFQGKDLKVQSWSTHAAFCWDIKKSEKLDVREQGCMLQRLIIKYSRAHLAFRRWKLLVQRDKPDEIL